MLNNLKLGSFDDDKDESYLRRRNQLLNFMKRQKWEDVDDKPSNKGRKPKEKPKPGSLKNHDPVILNKKQSKFFKF